MRVVLLALAALRGRGRNEDRSWITQALIYARTRGSPLILTAMQAGPEGVSGRTIAVSLPAPPLAFAKLQFRHQLEPRGLCALATRLIIVL